MAQPHSAPASQASQPTPPASAARPLEAKAPASLPDREPVDPAVMLFADRWSPIPPVAACLRPCVGRLLLKDRALVGAALLALLIALASALGGGFSSVDDETPTVAQATSPAVDAPEAPPPLPATPVQDLWGIYYP